MGLGSDAGTLLRDHLVLAFSGSVTPGASLNTSPFKHGPIMDQVIATPRPAAALGVFERYLTLWVALCIVAGITLGSIAPAPFQRSAR